MTDHERIIERLRDLTLSSQFAKSLVEQYDRKGSLSPKQWTAAIKTIKSRTGRFSPPRNWN